MKIFDWISRKPKKNQLELQATDHHHPSSLLHAPARSNRPSFTQTRPASAFTFDQDDPKKRREIVKIFVNHEEYGLLAIGTLGLYELTEIELFEVKPNVSLHPDGLKVHHHHHHQHQEPEHDDAQGEHDQAAAAADTQEALSQTDHQAVVVHKPSKPDVKKVFPLDPHLSIRRSKLTEKLLHPLNYLSSSSRRARKYSPNCTPDQAGQLVTASNNSPYSDDQQHRNNLSMLKKLFLKPQRVPISPSAMKQISMDPRDSPKRFDGSDKSRLSTTSSTSSSSSSSSRSKLKRAMAQLACMGVHGTEEDEEEDGNGSSSVHVGERGLSVPDSTCSAPGDPNAGYQPTSATDIKAGYWIRTDSDYVVLEL